ncbi:hypothetical protein CQW23_14561 [Capsicum baccatum]|uniref:Uncharacterized protein n=1 Tax=Capsicum baccatum TaxID=33114 RepID=A0A2G2WJI9_CAPBA|nr:hypothetical protein CQW23_14561 [Capsicum baccatum]
MCLSEDEENVHEEASETENANGVSKISDDDDDEKSDQAEDKREEDKKKHKQSSNKSSTKKEPVVKSKNTKPAVFKVASPPKKIPSKSPKSL